MHNFVECGSISLFRYACFRADVLTTDSPAAKRHPLSEGEAFRTRGMGQMRPIRLIIRHYESDEDLGFGFDGGHDAAGGMPTGEGGTGEGCAC